MSYIPNEKFCLGFMLIGAVILMTGILIPFVADDRPLDPDLIASGFMTLIVSTMLYSLARSRRKSAK